MATKKPAVKSEPKVEEVKEEVIESVKPKQTEAEIRKEIEELTMQGRDAPMTEQIYGIVKPAAKDPTDILPEPNGLLQGVTDPLQRFINMYQPGEFVMRQNFRKHLLQVLEDWREQFNPEEENVNDPQ
jgi:hypothetical protein